MNEIDVRDMEKSYGSVQAVRNVSFSIRRGEIVGLLGPNGAGKTTLIRALVGYHFPSGGRVAVHGHDVAEEPIAARAAFGYLPEDAPLYSELTVREILEFCAGAHRLRRRATERIEYVIETCGLARIVDADVRTISRGFRQRAALATAILHDPPILILDEPSTGLDPNQIVEIRGLIRSLGREKTVLLSTHMLSEVESVCDRVVIMNEGLIVADGPTAEVVRARGESKAYWVRFTERVEDAERLSSIPGVVAVHVERDRDDSVFVVEMAYGGGETIFAWAVENGLTVRELTPRTASLEQVFRSLTVDDDAPANEG